MNAPHSPEHSAEKETGRLESFSDGVFSIAMTLLILELTVPTIIGTVTDEKLLESLAARWPSYLSYVTSFATVLIMWVNHHGIFRLIRRTDSTLLMTNGFLLLLVTFVPFPTALVARFLRTPGAPAACAIYAGTFVLISLSYAILLLAARRNNGRLLAPGADPEISRRLRDCFFVGVPFYILATVVAPVSPWLSIAICTILWIFWAISRDGRNDGFAR